MPYSVGANTKATFEVGPEAHKLHLEFEVDGDIHVGQPVILHADGNKVSPATFASLESEIIGVSIHEGRSAYGDYVTIVVKGYAVINAQADEVIVPGPIMYAGYDTAQAYSGNQAQFGGYSRIANLSGGAQAQVETVTVAGSGGTMTLTIGGLTKTLTFNSDLDTTTDDFRIANATAYLALGIVLTDSTADLIFTANVAGTPFDVSDYDTGIPSDDLSASIVHTTPNTVAGATTKLFGWALDAAAAAYTIIRVLIKA